MSEQHFQSEPNEWGGHEVEVSFPTEQDTDQDVSVKITLGIGAAGLLAAVGIVAARRLRNYKQGK